MSHTKLTSPAAIAFARKGMCFVTVYVKAVPAGDIIKLTLQSSDPISYLCWQFRNQDPVVGYNESMVRVLVNPPYMIAG